MRIVAWNCNMALDRKIEVLLALKPDIAIVSECAEPDRLRFRRKPDWVESKPVWIGRNPHKGLAVFGFNGYAARIAEIYEPRFRYIAPVRISGPVDCNLLAVWAQNASAGITRKRQAGPLRRALAKYKEFISAGPGILAGDLNNNVIWDKPGWRNNHNLAVAALASLGLLSAYHEFHGEQQGGESRPTLYWRDRRKDGPTYHIDYVFLPDPWIRKVKELRLGRFEDWCGAGLSDHVPVIVDVGL
jgi:exodeoxyribonuclease III